MYIKVHVQREGSYAGLQASLGHTWKRFETMRSAFVKNGPENVHWTQANIAGFVKPVSHGR